ncbi:MAG TPA: M3 family oligoendopeptidase [Ignavibacteria bacterium]|nr:M3 family oligoendopeptidase [Ignavibacteria bacterium]
MKFSQMNYSRIDMNQFEEKFNVLLENFINAESPQDQVNAINKINELRNDFDTNKVLSFINYSIDTANEQFNKDQEFYDENTPLYQNLVSKFYLVLTTSKFRKALENYLGRHLFDIAERMLKTFDPAIIEDLQKENHLGSEYVKLKASALVEFDGKKLNLMDLEPFMENTDRDVRKKACEVYWNYFNENKSKFDELYDKLVKLRTEMALKLGYKNFVELGYARMKRTDYNAEMVKNFRNEVKQYVVPLATSLRERQQKRLGLDNLYYYDSFLQFKNGNPSPKGTPEWIIEQGKEMYRNLSIETGTFFDFMMNNELMDVYSRKGKADMGYCEYIPNYKSPFIFANMNGTEGDITVLTHEAGHAFQAYSSRDFKVKEYMEPTMETAEIHSMSMEFLTWDYMKLFFNGDTEKFKFSHLNGAILIIPYLTLVDEYQHHVYENPTLTPDQRNSLWRKLEKEYMPHLDYADNSYLETGGRWQRQGHIFEVPFYYIDYALAQICAFQFWKLSKEDKNLALEKYIFLCKEGGSKSFTTLLKSVGIKSPFDTGTVKEVITDAEKWLDSIDDSRF